MCIKPSVSSFATRFVPGSVVSHGLLILLFFLVSASYSLADSTRQYGTFSDSAVVLTEELISSGLSENVWYYLDESNEFDINTIQQLSVDDYIHGSKKKSNFGMAGDASLWVRVDVNNKMNFEVERSFELAYPLLDVVELYRVDQGELARLVADVGESVEFGARAVQYRFFIFPTSFSANEKTTFYFKVKNQGAIRVPLSIWQPDALVEKIALDSSVFGIYYGIIIALLLYNLFIYMSVRDTNYLYYLLFVGTFCSGIAYMNGLAFQFIWPNSPVINNYLGPCLLSFGFLSAFYFVLNFLSAKEKYPNYYRMFYIIGFASAFMILLGMTYEVRLLVYVTLFSGLVTAFSVFAVLLRAATKNHPGVIYLIVALMVLIGGSVAIIFATLGWIPFNFFTQNAFQIGSAAEAILFSFALAARINQLKSDVISAQGIAIENMDLYRESLETARDAEAKQQVEEKKRFIAEYNRKLSDQKNAEKSKFFATMSHEFRTPLTAIIGYTELALQEQIALEERLFYVKTVNSSAQHMRALINDILDISKIEAQKLEVECIDFELESVLKQVHDICWMHASQKAIVFDVVYGKDVPRYANSDPTRLKQTLINLCSNGIKFTEEGSVTLNVGYIKSSNSLQFTIKDTGIGIRPQQLEKLFAAFEQAESSTNRQYGGTGLGLYLSQQIALKLKGDVRVESVVGEGSTFTLQVDAGVPRINESRKNAQVESGVSTNLDRNSSNQKIQLPKSKQQRKKVLVAEDNEVNLRLITALLEKAGADVVAARTGVEAIAQGLLSDFDLVLMDIEMPVMGGVEALQWLKRSGVKTSVYALTGNTSKEDKALYAAEGFQGHLEKPIDSAVILSIVNQ